MIAPEERGEIRTALLAKIEEIKNGIHELEDVTKPIAPDNAIGRVSRMDAIVNKSVNEGILQKARHQLVLLENALARIEKPDYGLCVRCGKEIPFGRLVVMPETTKCTTCV
ncbi:MAG: TraR/DksA C4-type zinc finger protein [Bacteroidota bacterium]